MPQVSTERGTMGEAASWSGTELRSITETLQELRDRLASLADELQARETAAAGAEARRAITSAATEDSAEPFGEAAELLLATVQCVIVDSLDPAIQSLVELQPSLDRGELRR
jgi:hypothetical protein